MRRTLLGFLLLAGCHDAKTVTPPPPAEPVTRTTTAAALDSLPTIPVVAGQLLCLAVGGAQCPSGPITANWLHDGRFATWEPHHQVLVWTPSNANPQLLGEVGAGEQQYDFVASVAATRTGYIILSAVGMHALRYDAKGAFESSMPIPPIGLSHATGYSGDVPFYQVIHENGADSGAEFAIREIDVPGDTLGHAVLTTRLNWLRLKAGRPTAPLPLFPILPSFALAPDSDVVWSIGDQFVVERRSATGKLRWSLTSDATGPAVTPTEINDARAKYPGGTDAKASKARFDSSVANTGRFHPAIGAIYLAGDGRVLAASVAVAAHDSVQYTVLTNTGQPTLRFALPRATRVALFAGDSVLAQRAGANAQQELRWLIVRAPARP